MVDTEIKEEEFQYLLNSSKEDIFTKLFFERLIKNENTAIFSANESDVESLNVFVYEDKEHYTYYIPNEIKSIIKKELNLGKD